LGRGVAIDDFAVFGFAVILRPCSECTRPLEYRVGLIRSRCLGLGEELSEISMLILSRLHS